MLPQDPGKKLFNILYYLISLNLLRNLDPFFSVYKGENFYDFLFAFLRTKSRLKRVLLEKGKRLPANGSKSIMIMLPPLKLYLFSLSLPHYILEESIFDFRYVRLYDVDIPTEKWLNYSGTSTNGHLR